MNFVSPNERMLIKYTRSRAGRVYEARASVYELVGRRLTPAGPISPVSVRTTKTSSAFSKLKMAKNNARLAIEFFSMKVSPSNCEGISPNLNQHHSLIGVSD